MWCWLVLIEQPWTWFILLNDEGLLLILDLPLNYLYKPWKGIVPSYIIHECQVCSSKNLKLWIQSLVLKLWQFSYNSIVEISMVVSKSWYSTRSWLYFCIVQGVPQLFSPFFVYFSASKLKAKRIKDFERSMSTVPTFLTE